MENTKDTLDLPTESEIPWSKTASLGDGVAAPSGDLLQRAVGPFTAVPGETRREEFHFWEIRSEEDIKNLVSVNVHSGFNTAALSTTAEAYMERSLQVSSFSSSVVCKGRFIWEPSALASPFPHLITDAWELYEKDPAEFHRAHGHYFIAGFTKEAELLIFIRVMGTSRKSVDKATGELEAKWRSVGMEIDGSMATDIEKSVERQHCELEIDLLKTGMSTDENIEATGLALSDVPGHIKDFRERAIGTNTMASLVHYTRIEPRISTKTDVDADMYIGAEQLYQNLVVAKVLKSMLPKYYAQHDMVKQLKAIENDAVKYVPRDLSGDINRLNDLLERIEHWLADAKDLESYRRLWHEMNANRNRARDWGVTGWKDPELAHLDIESKHDYIYKPYNRKHQGYQQGNLSIKVQDRIICGIKLTNRHGKHPGTCEITDGGLEDDHVDFRFKSDYNRGFEWIAYVWSTPEEKHHFAPDEI